MTELLAEQATQPQAAASSAFDTYLILYNPASTQATRAMNYVDQLRTLVPDDAIIFVPTSPEGKQANRALLVAQAHQLGSRTLLIIAGGDGTINLVVDTLLHDSRFTPEMRETTILPIWGGNGNDLAHMLNGKPHRSVMQRLLQKGRRVTIYPLSCEITSEDKTTTHTAVCYASFGASAFAAWRLESLRGVRPFFHNIGAVKFMHELGMVLKALARAPLVMISDGGDKASKTIYDQVFINGSRFAKVNGSPLKLTDKQFYHITVEQKRLSSMAYHIAALTRRHSDRYIVPAGHDVSFMLHEATWAQLDGEVVNLTAGTNVRVSIAEEPFYALSTILS